MGKLSIHPKILALPWDEYEAWFVRTGLKGKPTDYRKKPKRKEEEGGQ